MYQKTLLVLLVVLLGVVGCTQAQQNTNETMLNYKQPKSMQPKVVKTEEEWKAILSPEQYYILRQKGTERPYTGKLLDNKAKGVYCCAACGFELFTSDQKFDSHCGWPSFFDEMAGDRIKKQIDKTHGMTRVEILCANCDGHLGHVFEDGPEPTGLRYCVNSVSLEFKKKD